MVEEGKNQKLKEIQKWKEEQEKKCLNFIIVLLKIIWVLYSI